MPGTLSKDQELLNGLIRGNSKTLKTIYEQHSKAILHLVTSKGGTPDDARDVFQEGLMLFYQKAKDPTFELHSAFLTYLYALCRNIWLNKVKKKSFSEGTLTDEMTSILKEEVVLEVERNERYFLYRKKFSLLGEQCRKVLSLFMQKVSMEEICQQLSFSSISYTKKRKFLCKKKLIELIRQDPAYVELKD